MAESEKRNDGKKETESEIGRRKMYNVYEKYGGKLIFRTGDVDKLRAELPEMEEHHSEGLWVAVTAKGRKLPERVNYREELERSGAEIMPDWRKEIGSVVTEFPADLPQNVQIGSEEEGNPTMIDFMLHEGRVYLRESGYEDDYYPDDWIPLPKAEYEVKQRNDVFVKAERGKGNNLHVTVRQGRRKTGEKTMKLREGDPFADFDPFEG